MAKCWKPKTIKGDTSFGNTRDSLTTLRIFISHSMSEEDKHILENLKKQMPRGISVYVAEWNPTPGKSLKDKIRRNLQKCDAVLAILTKDGVRSQWVNQEIGVALAEGKDIIPIRERGVDVKGFIQDIEWITLDRDSPENALKMTTSYLAELRSRKEEKTRFEIGFWGLLLAAIFFVLTFIFLAWAFSKSE